jgi:hypothetical protein
VVAEGGSFTLGQELAGRGGFTTYNLADWDLTNDETLIAGQASAIGLSIQGISANQLTTLKNRMEQTKSRIESKATAGITADAVSGDALISAIWTYYVSLENHGKTLAGKALMVDRPGLSYGLTHARMQPIKVFGLVTTSVRFSGFQHDVGHLRYLRSSKTNDPKVGLSYTLARGAHASAMEHLTLENSFIDRTKCNSRTQLNPDLTKPACTDGVSTMAALAFASRSGQKIFRIDRTNINLLALQLSQSSRTMSTVSNAVNAGKVVTIHQARVTIGSWTGAGYSIADPDTGASSYLIEGGANGGELETEESKDVSLSNFLDSLKDSAEWLAGVFEEYGAKIAKILGRAVGGIFDLYDFKKLWSACNGIDAYFAFTFFTFWLLLASASVVGTLTFGFFIFFVAFAIKIWLTSLLMEALTTRCEQ